MTTHVAVVPKGLLTPLPIAESSEEASGSQTASATRPLLRLPHPRTGYLSLFAEWEGQLLEVQAISPDAPRSWMFSEGSVISNGKLLLMTPVDAAFILVPLLQAVYAAQSGETARFLPIDDLFEAVVEKTNSLLEVMNSDSQSKEKQRLRPQDIMSLAQFHCIKAALPRICDCKEAAPDLWVYRFSPPKLLELLRSKVDALSDPTVFNAFPSLTRSLAKDGLGLENNAITEELRHDGRRRSACDVLSQYLSPDMTSTLVASYNFTFLNAHLKAIKDEQLALTPAPVAKETQASSTGEKKRKATTQSSRGVEKLKKVNTNGMAAISKFFVKKEKV